MIKTSLLAAALAAPLATSVGAGIYIPPKPSIVKPENIEFSKHLLLLGMPLTMGMLAAVPGVGPYSIIFRGVYQTNTTSFTSPAIDIGRAYTDRIVLVGVYSNSSTTNSILVGGTPASNLVTSIYQDSWWKAIDVPGESVTITGTGADAFRTLFIYTVTGISDGKNATLDPRSAASNNDNSHSLTYPSSSIGDVFLAIGHKGGTGSSDNWGTFGGTAGVTQTGEYRIGTAGSGWGGHGISPQQITTGSKTITASGSDSSKAISLSALRISL